MKPTLLFCLGLILYAASLPQKPAAKTNAAVAAPSLDQILDNYETAIGGRQAWAGITSRAVKGTLELPQSATSGTFESYEAQPGKIYLLMRFGNGAESKVGFDGEVGWATNPQTGLHRLSGEELVDVKRGAQLPEEIRFREFFTQMRLRGEDKIRGRDAYVVEASSSEGSPWTIYFDAKTWLRIRIEWTHSAPEGLESVQTNYDDYRELEGSRMKFAFRITEKTSRYTIIQHVEEVRLNVPIDQSLFTAPSFKVRIQH